jgi:hypothetical protein
VDGTRQAKRGSSRGGLPFIGDVLTRAHYRDEPHVSIVGARDMAYWRQACAVRKSGELSLWSFPVFSASAQLFQART